MAERKYSMNSDMSPLSGMLGAKSMAALKSFTGQEEEDEILENLDGKTQEEKLKFHEERKRIQGQFFLKKSGGSCQLD